jgi:hypothetical protein
MTWLFMTLVAMTWIANSEGERVREERKDPTEVIGDHKL